MQLVKKSTSLNQPNHPILTTKLMPTLLITTPIQFHYPLELIILSKCDDTTLSKCRNNHNRADWSGIARNGPAVPPRKVKAIPVGSNEIVFKSDNGTSHPTLSFNTLTNKILVVVSKTKRESSDDGISRWAT